MSFLGLVDDEENGLMTQQAIRRQKAIISNALEKQNRPICQDDAILSLYLFKRRVSPGIVSQQAKPDPHALLCFPLSNPALGIEYRFKVWLGDNLGFLTNLWDRSIK